MPDLIPVLSREEIAQQIASVARQISRDFEGRNPVIIGVLKGAFIFLADLARQLNIPFEVDFIRAASYGSATTSSGTIKLTKDVETDLTDRDVIVVEDIVDTGLTLRWLLDHLRSRGARSVRVCALLDKQERRQVTVAVDYACHRVAEGFLVGYGLDCNEQYRGLPEIYHLKTANGIKCETSQTDTEPIPDISEESHDHPL